MSTLIVKDGTGVNRYLEAEGAGTEIDPHTTKSIITGQKPDGSFDNIQTSAEGAIISHEVGHDSPNMSVHMTAETGVTDTFAVASAKGDMTVTVGNGTQWSLGNKVKVNDLVDDDNTEYDILTIKGIATNDVTFDRPLDINHAIGTEIVGVTQNMAIDGSSVPVTFFYAPKAGTKIHIHSLHVIFASGSEPALYKFGGSDALTYGAHFRVTRPSGRDDTSWIPCRSMNAMVLDGFSYVKEAKVGTTWFARLHLDLLATANSVIVLDDSLGERLECTIRDDNTTNTSMEVKLSIHDEAI